jgi:hypothetical protein
MNEMPVDGVSLQIDDAFLQVDHDQRGTRIESSKRHRDFLLAYKLEISKNLNSQQAA